jgi:DNA (cytosine-5)-methyltransferase 1
VSAYYNENEPYCVEWLRNLIAAGLIAPGDVDDRSIKDVRPDDLRGYTQCHFFAGIAGWSLALRMAGWDDARPAWTSSCPCQPFSGAGKGLRQSDERHLWPHQARLIRECRPATIFGEQVDDAIAAGWIDDVFADLEAETYACAADVLPACSIGADHERQRIFWVADTASERRAGLLRNQPRIGAGEARKRKATALDSPCSAFERRGNEGVGEPAFFVSNDGLSNQVGRLRAFGNAIVPEVAAEFIAAYMEAAA